MIGRFGIDHTEIAPLATENCQNIRWRKHPKFASKREEC